jgi:hypothetical protein
VGPLGEALPSEWAIDAERIELEKPGVVCIPKETPLGYIEREASSFTALFL